MAALIDAQNLGYHELNMRIREEIERGERNIRVKNVNGQRYIGTGMGDGVHLLLEGIAGNNLAAFGDGIEIKVVGNAQDGVANTLSKGKVVIHGNTGDTVAYSARGGKVFIRGYAGYRVGIHMKAHEEGESPFVVIGEKVGDFLGEYMAGGTLVVLGLNARVDEEIAGRYYIGTGMHGGRIFLRGNIQQTHLSPHVRALEIDDKDLKDLEGIISEFAEEFGLDAGDIMAGSFMKLVPASSRPYGALYA